MGWCDKTIGIAIHRLPDDNTNTIIEGSIYFQFFELPSDLERIREDYVDAVSGRLLKMMRRAGNDQFYYVSRLYGKERTLKFAESFVDLVFYKIADGQPGKLKKKSNDLSDGFYAATLYQWDDAFKTTKAEVEAAKAAKKEKEARS
ncbi:MAG: hypothetical protein C5S48_02185 [Candidatus Methanogaster sp.]|nr:MAG: hypothetical protein C5S48_02185 [ANME-2 cluster archaeon]